MAEEYTYIEQTDAVQADADLYDQAEAKGGDVEGDLTVSGKIEGSIDVSNIVGLAPVATSGDYADLTGTPTEFEGATASADGASGLVPKPLAGDQDKFLKGDGTWGTVEAAIDAALDVMLKTKIYPVGSTFFSLTDSRNPSVILGFGTWAKIEGRFLLGASSSYATNSTGGEATHTLTASELPDPATYLAVQYAWAGSTVSGTWRFVVQNYATEQWSGVGRIKSTSATHGQAHNNMPPYLAGHLWRRTA